MMASVMGIANAERSFSILRSLVQFASRPENTDVIPMYARSPCVAQPSRLTPPARYLRQGKSRERVPQQRNLARGHRVLVPRGLPDAPHGDVRSRPSYLLPLTIHHQPAVPPPIQRVLSHLSFALRCKPCH
jgi:hypothetical protein